MKLTLELKQLKLTQLRVRTVCVEEEEKGKIIGLTSIIPVILNEEESNAQFLIFRTMEENKEEVVHPKESKFLPKVLIAIGLPLGLLILGLLIVTFAPAVVKMVGLVGSIASVVLGWSELSRINKKRKK